MGTTVTTNLSLIKPDLSESIKEDLPTFAGWAAQNEINMDTIDSLFRATTHTYVPSWTASVSNPVLGTGGFVEGSYLRLFPRMVFGHFKLYTGTTGSSAGSGFYNVTAPVAMSPELITFADSVPVGKAVYSDTSAVVNSSIFQVFCSVTSGNFFFKAPNGVSWTNASPVGMGQDRLTGFFMYPTSAA